MNNLKNINSLTTQMLRLQEALKIPPPSSNIGKVLKFKNVSKNINSLTTQALHFQEVLKTLSPSPNIGKILKFKGASGSQFMKSSDQIANTLKNINSLTTQMSRFQEALKIPPPSSNIGKVLKFKDVSKSINSLTTQASHFQEVLNTLSPSPNLGKILKFKGASGSQLMKSSDQIANTLKNINSLTTQMLRFQEALKIPPPSSDIGKVLKFKDYFSFNQLDKKGNLLSNKNNIIEYFKDDFTTITVRGDKSQTSMDLENKPKLLTLERVKILLSIIDSIISICLKLHHFFKE